MHKILRFFYDFYGLIDKTNNMLNKIARILCAIILVIGQLHAQDQPVINGNFETNVNVFLRDSAINAVAQPQYQNQFYGGEAWLNVSYAYNGFTAGVRYDMFNNSNLRDPNDSYTAQGI